MTLWKNLARLLCLSLSLWGTEALNAIDLATPTSVSTFTCFKNSGYSIAIVRGYQSYGQTDSNAPTNIANARSAGFQYVDVYAFPCRGMSASTQMNQLIDYLSGYNSKYGMIWLDLESNPKSSCDWKSYSYTDNCNYVQQMVSAVKARGKQVGIYSSYGNWESIFGSSTACKSFTDLPLWYAHYDNSASFSDWSRLSFGGWTNPAMKQYVGDTTVCSTDVDKSIESGFYTSSAYTGGSSNSCTKPVSTGGVKVTFPSGVTLTSIQTCDTAYTDPNNAGTYVFSVAASGSTTKLSTNFQLAEFQSPDNADGIRVSPVLVTCLQNIRTSLKVPVYIEMAYETTTYSNNHNGGATESYHMSGTAADIYISGDVMSVANAAICQCRDLFVENKKDIGLGLGDTFVHVDMRSSFASWVEAGAKYTASQWQSYISSTYTSCSSKDYGGISSVQSSNNFDHSSGCSGNGVKFPNTCLTPVYYSDSKYKDPNNAGESLFSASQSGKNTMLSNNFAVKEFVCKDGSDGFRLAPELVQCLQAVRDVLKSPVYINSAYRTVTHNADEGGAEYSRHMSGTAADAYSSAGLWNYANAVICKCRAIFQANGQDIGLGLGGTYIHADMRPYYSYWVYSDASMSASSWNNYIASQWSKCSTSSRTDISNEDVNEDQDHSDMDTEEGVETDTVDGASQNSSSGKDKNTVIIVPVVVVGALVIIALIAYFTYRRIALNRKQTQSDIPLTNYVNLQTA